MVWPGFDLAFLFLPANVIAVLLIWLRHARRTQRTSSDVLFAALNDGSLHLSRQGVLLKVDPAFCKLINTDESDLLGTNLDALLSPTSAPEIQTRLETINTTWSACVQMRSNRLRGIWLDVELWIEVKAPRSGVLVASCRDVTAEADRVRDLVRAMRRISQGSTIESIVTNILKSFADATANKLETAISQAMEAISEYVAVSRCYILKVDSKGTAPTCAYQWHRQNIFPLADSELCPSKQLFDWLAECFKFQAIFYIPDRDCLPETAIDDQRLWNERGVGSFLAVAMVADGTFKGAICFESEMSPPAWLEEEIILLKTVGEILVNAWERRRVETELRVAHRRLLDIVEFLPDATFVIDSSGRVVAWNRAMEEMTGVFKQEMIGQGEFAYATPFYGKRVPVLIDQFGEHGTQVDRQFYEFVHMEKDKLYAESFVPSFNDGKGAYLDATGQMVDQVLTAVYAKLTRQTALVGDIVIRDDRFCCYAQSVNGDCTTFYLESSAPWNPGDLNLIRIFGSYVAIVADNLNLHREIIEIQKEIIHTLGEVVETRSHETANHVLRVGELTHLLARKVGLSSRESAMLRMASPMHDVGKVGIPDAILNKPDSLDELEHDIIKKHTQIGYAILKKSSRPIIQAAATVSLQHHERWDGTGYPNKLSGEQIHIYGRITAVADVFDALCSKRVYRDAVDPSQVREYFQRERGRCFDPTLVDIFVKDFPEFVAILQAYPDIETTGQMGAGTG